MPITKVTNETAVQCSPAQCAESEINGTSVQGGADTYTLCGCESSGGIPDVSSLLKSMAPLILFGAMKAQGRGDPAEGFLKRYASQIEKLPEGERKVAYEHLGFLHLGLARSEKGVSAIGHYEKAIEAYEKAGGRKYEIADIYIDIFKIDGVNKSKQKEVLNKAYKSGLWSEYAVLEKAMKIDAHDMIVMVYSDMLKAGDKYKELPPLGEAIKYFEKLPFEGEVRDRQVHILQEILKISPEELGTIAQRYLTESQRGGINSEKYRDLGIWFLDLQMHYYLVRGELKNAVALYRSISKLPGIQPVSVQKDTSLRLVKALRDNAKGWVENWLEARVAGWSKMPIAIKRHYIEATARLTQNDWDVVESSDAFLTVNAFEDMMDERWRESRLPPFTAKPQTSQPSSGPARSAGVEGPVGVARSASVEIAEARAKVEEGREGEKDGRETEPGKKGPEGPGRIK